MVWHYCSRCIPGFYLASAFLSFAPSNPEKGVQCICCLPLLSWLALVLGRFQGFQSVWRSKSSGLCTSAGGSLFVFPPWAGRFQGNWILCRWIWAAQAPQSFWGQYMAYAWWIMNGLHSFASVSRENGALHFWPTCFCPIYTASYVLIACLGQNRMDESLCGCAVLKKKLLIGVWSLLNAVTKTFRVVRPSLSHPGAIEGTRTIGQSAQACCPCKGW